MQAAAVQPPSGSTRLLAGPRSSVGAESLAAHRARLGDLPTGRDRADLIPVLEASGLLGRGGAGFPVGRKWRSVSERARGHAVVVVNGAEGEPASAKDRTLMTLRPQLVVDGALLAADAVGAEEVVFYVGSAHSAAKTALARAITERSAELGRRVRVRLNEAPEAYVAGEESAAVHYINAGDARPTLVPPRPYERGVAGKPTLVQNVESLAYAALIARFGDAWYRSAGQSSNGGRGTGLITVSGAVSRQGVREIELGTRVGQVAAAAGTSQPGVEAVLVGGYFGAWMPAEEAWDLELDPTSMRARGLPFGCGVVSFLPVDGCGVSATARIMAYMAGQSAEQCGPCVFGLRAIADATSRLASGTGSRDDLDRLERWAGQIVGRGACRHPDGAVGLLLSGLRTFEDEFRLHAARGRCSIAGTAAGAA